MNSLIVIIISLLFSAFFSGMEIAFVSANKLKVELDKKSGGTYAKLLSGILRSPARFIATMLVGNNISLVIYGVVMAKILEPKIAIYVDSDFFILLLQTIISTFIILVTAEFLPKAFFRINPNKFLNVFALPLAFFYYLLFPIVQLIIFLSKKGLRLIGTSLVEDKPVFGKVDLEEYLKQLSNIDSEDIDVEVQMLQNALDFSKVKARECMIPRTEIIALEVDSTIDSLLEIFIETKLSKVLIYKGNIDQVIGYTHSSEMFKSPKKIRDILLPIPIVPETILANELLELFIKERKAVALVVDEFGGTSGIVTIEDVMEEIFGEIEDEYDENNSLEEKMDDGSFIFSARLEIDYLNEKYGFKLPVLDEYETLGGFIIHHYESIPNELEEITLESCQIKIVKASENRIEKVLFRTLVP